MHTSDATPLVLTIEQAAKRLGIGRTLAYALVSSGEIESVTIGRLRRIPAECLTEYIDRLRRQRTQLPAAA
jgi:excisionase family DNA binding protein